MNRLPSLLFVCVALAWMLSADMPAQTTAAARSWDVTAPKGQPRSIDFTTTEGTWMNVDVSPDGQWVVFNLLAHIYRVSASGGPAQCLTEDSGIAINFHPRISPDGATIVFVSDRDGQANLWLMDLDGSNPRPVTRDARARFMEPSWSPDGRFIVARRIDAASILGVSIAIVHRDGGQGTQLVRVENDMYPGGPKLSPDGRFLYYHVGLGASRGMLGPADTLRGDYQIHRLDLIAGRTDEVTSGIDKQQDRASSGGAYAPELSPDGRFMAFARRMPDGVVTYKNQSFGPRTALWLRDLRTGAERLLMDPIETDGTEGFSVVDQVLPGYRWSADGRSIVIAQGGGIRRLDVTTGQVASIPFEARVRRSISERVAPSIRISDGPFDVRFPRWHTASPDGKTLAFQAVGRIWLMDLPSGTPRRLTSSASDHYEYYPAWSPDGRSLLFVTWEEGVGGHIWTISASGGTPRRVSEEPAEYVEPVWSPDASLVVATLGDGATARGQGLTLSRSYQLVSIPVAGGTWRPIVRVKGSTPRLSFSRGRSVIPRASFGPDGRIYYYEPGAAVPSGSAGLRVVSVRPNGNDPREHVQIGSAAEIAISPDARSVAFTAGDGVYVAPMSATGYTEALPSIGIADGQLPVRRLSTDGGLYPRWRDARTVTFGNGRRFVTYTLPAGETTTADIALRVPRAIPPGSIALTNVRILTMEQRQVIPRGAIVVRAGRIACVGRCSTAGVDRTVDGGGRTVIPGLIDVHAHHHREYENIQPPRSYESAVYLAYGVTTTMDPGTSSIAAFPAAELIEAGGMIGPRTFTAAEIVTSGEGGRWTTPQDAHASASRRASWGATSLKDYTLPTRHQRQWLVEAGRTLGVNVTAEGLLGIEQELALVMDGHSGAEHSTPYAPLYGDFTKFLGLSGFGYSSTPLVIGPGPWNQDYFLQETDVWRDAKARRWLPWRQLIPHARRRMLRPKTDYPIGMMAQAAADVVAAGGLAPIGSHGQQHGIGSHWDTWIYAEAMGPMGALEAATLHGARALGMDRDLGSIGVGKLADFVVLDGDPLKDIRNTASIKWVMKGGILYEAESLDEVWPNPRPFGRYYWVEPDAYRSTPVPVDPPGRPK